MSTHPQGVPSFEPREHPEIYRLILDSLPHEAMLVRPSDGKVLLANSAARQRGCLAGGHCMAVRTGQVDQPCECCRLPQVLDTREPQQFERQVGEQRYEYHWVPLDEDLGLQYTIDITERRQLERERLLLERQYHTVQKNETVALLMGGLAHDFNNLLASMMGYAEMLNGELPPDSRHKRYASMILESAEQARRLSHNLLNYARPVPRNSRRLDLHDVIRNVVRLIEPTCTNINVRLDLAENLDSSILGDESQLGSIFMNLALNARDAMPEGGVIEIATQPAAPEMLDQWDALEETSSCDSPGQFIQVLFKDNGIGIKEEDRERIFDPFFTTKPDGEGTGLGLACVKKFIQNQGGYIGVNSRCGDGAQFTLLFPLADQAGTPQKEPVPIMAAETNHDSKEGARILFADDESSVRGVIREILESLGHEVFLFENGRDAVEHYRKEGQNIDLVLLDIKMPVLNGWEAFHELKRIDPGVKAIFITGYSGDVKLDEAVAEGIRRVIPKPFRISEIREAIDEALSESG